MTTTTPERTVPDGRLPELHPDAVALTAFRGVNGIGRQYTATEFDAGAEAIRFWLRRAWKIGFVKTHTSAEDGPCDCYAVLDVLNADYDIVQDFCIPTAKAFRWWYRILELRVDHPKDAR